MTPRPRCLPLILALVLAILVGSAPAVRAESPPAAQSPSPAEIEATIALLEDDEARARLIAQLKILAVSQQASKPTSQVRSATSEALRAISGKLESFSRGFAQVGRGIQDLPQAADWAREQFAHPDTRRLWTEVITNLALALGLGLLAFVLVRLLLLRPRRSLAAQSEVHLLLRALRLTGLLALDFLPIGAFALTAYLLLGVLSPRELTRLVALAWINAFILVQVLLSVARFFLAGDAPGLRLPTLSDESAHYGEIWIARLLRTAIYGYFTLQAALLLGLPAASYAVLMRTLGLVVGVLVILIIFQNRAAVADLIRGPAEASEAGLPRAGQLRRRLARTWHLLATAYVLILYSVWALQIEGGFLYLLRATALTIALFALARLSFKALEAGFTRGFRISEELQSHFPKLEERANRYLSTVHKLLRLLIYAFTLLAVLQIWGIDTFGWLTSESGRVLGGAVATVLAIILVTFLIWEVANTLIENYLSQQDHDGTLIANSRTRTLLAVARKALLIALSVIATLMILSNLGVDIAPLLAGAGVLGLAVGFGAQKLVQDVITGVFILIEDQISVGDVVNTGDRAGVVEAVSIRTVRLRDLTGTVHTIPYSAITTVSNLTKEFSYYVFEVGVAYRENVDEVMEVLRQIGAELQDDPEYGPKILEPLEVLGVDAFADSAVIIKTRIKTTPIKQWWVGREFNRRMKNRFDELGIEIPFPHTTIYFGEDKQGQAPPAHLDIRAPQPSSAAPAANAEPGEAL